MNRGAWWATGRGSQSQTWLKWLSMHACHYSSRKWIHMVTRTGSVLLSLNSPLLCQLSIGPRRLLRGLNHVLLHLLASNTFLKGVQGGEQKWGTPCSGKTGRTGLQTDIFRSWFHEPDPCISLYLEKRENPLWWWLLLMTSSNLLQKICAWLHGVSLHQNHICTDHPHPHPLTSLELFLRSIQNAVSQDIVLILPLIKFDSHLSCCTFFLSRCLPFMSLSVLVRRQLRTFWCFIHDSASKWISTKVEHWNNNNWRMWYNVSILTILNASSQH